MPHDLSSKRIFNVYCDESSHLENDHHTVMVLGALWCPLEKSQEIADHIRGIKKRHDLNPHLEIKWNKVSPAKEQFYTDLIDYFFDEDMRFRVLVIPDKSKLRHEDFEQNHDTFYYKMYYQLLSVLLSSKSRYRIYIDAKDTRGTDKALLLHEILASAKGDPGHNIIERVQNVRAREIEMMQLADLLIGAVAYANRGLSASKGKEAMVRHIGRRSRRSITMTTPLTESKFNVFVWRALEAHA